MKLVFIDETGDKKIKDYLGICVALIDATHYPILKDNFQKILRESSWNESIEFKGSHLFSASKGDISVNVDKRIVIAEKILNLNVANKNSRMVFHFGSQRGVRKISTTYLDSLPSFLAKVLPKPQKGGKAKNLLAITCDYRNDLSDIETHKKILPVLNKKGWELFEQVSVMHSNFHTVGILFADIVGYLAGRIDTIQNDAGLFENIPLKELEQNGKYRKLMSSTKLLGLVKRLNLYNRVDL